MPNYLTKEDIKRWRSSLERCTLEQYAEKLGKVIQNEKETYDIIDMVFEKNGKENDTYANKSNDAYFNRYNGEKITSNLNMPSIKKKPLNIVKPEKMANKSINKNSISNNIENKNKPAKENLSSILNNEISFNKPLTDREQMVFEHFYKNKNTTVYAKDLAQILSLPRDYVYKYIKNLRAKLSRDILINCEKGGYILKL